MKAYLVDTTILYFTGAFLEIEAGAARADEIYAPALIKPRVCCCIVIANADCACSNGRGHDL